MLSTLDLLFADLGVMLSLLIVLLSSCLSRGVVVGALLADDDVGVELWARRGVRGLRSAVLAVASVGLKGLPSVLFPLFADIIGCTAQSMSRSWY